MKKEKALELLKRFPTITPKIEKQMKNQLEQFLMYDTKRDQCFCTRCEALMPIPENIRHRHGLICPCCKEGVTAIHVNNRFAGGTVESEARCIVYLSSPEDENLYIRCFELKVFFMSKSLTPIYNIVEHQRYVFTEKDVVRYGRDAEWTYMLIGNKRYWCEKHWQDEWKVRTRFREPVFNNMEKTYTCLNAECVKDTCMRYSEINQIPFEHPMYPVDYLRYYQKHPGVERLIKTGLVEVVRDQFYSSPIYSIDYSQTEPHKMIGVTKDVFQAIRSQRITLRSYLRMKKYYSDMTLEEVIRYQHIIGECFRDVGGVKNLIRESDRTILKYLCKQKDKYSFTANIHYYQDYLVNCEQLGYDLMDNIVKFPRDLMRAHDRAASALEALIEEKQRKDNEEKQKALEKLMKERKKLEFSAGEYFVRQPKSVNEIVDEGKALGHCVAGYAQRHAQGILTIMFLRKKDDPEKPYFTIEVSRSYKIVQCHGYKNDVPYNGGIAKPDEIKEFEKLYQTYLDKVHDKEVKDKAKATKQLKKGA